MQCSLDKRRKSGAFTWISSIHVFRLAIHTMILVDAYSNLSLLLDEICAYQYNLVDVSMNE